MMLGTILFYNFIVLSSTFFVYFSEKCKYRFDRNILLFIALLIIFIPSAIRYNIGTDFPSYINIYNKLENYTHMEAGFYYINKFLRFINAHAQWSIAVLAFIFSYAAISSYPKKDAWILHLAFTLSLLFFSFNGVRQAIAIAFTLWAFHKYFHEKYIQALFLIIFGGLFHSSNYLYIPIGLVAFIPFSYTFKAYIFPAFFILIITIFYFFTPELIKIAEFITIKLDLKYQRYFNSYHFMVRDWGTGLGALTKQLFCIYTLTKSKQLLQISKRNWLLIIIVFLTAIASILNKEIVIFSRLEKVFAVSIPIALYMLNKIDRYFSFTKTIVILFIVFLILIFQKEMISEPTKYSDPMLAPYQSILSKDL